MRVVTIIPTYNEGRKIEKVISRVPPGVSDEVVVVDDGSAVPLEETLKGLPITILRHQKNRGVGASIRTGLEYGLKKDFDVVVIMAGNGKDDPEEIPRLLEPIVSGKADYVIGSRFAPGGRSVNLPVGRHMAIKILSWLYSSLGDFRITDITNGFRAYRLAIIRDERIRIWQDWLNRYEMECYIFHKAVKFKYRAIEVPVSKVYPAHRVDISKIRPIADGWRMVRFIIYLALKIKD